MNGQLEIPLFPPDMMEKVKEGHRLIEAVKKDQEIEHLKHVIAGHLGKREQERRRKIK